MSLPKMSGEKFITFLKENKETINIPIITITAQAMKGDKEAILKRRCNGYVSKPIDQAELLEEIRRVFR